MTGALISLTEIFFRHYCGSNDGGVPDCRGCEYNELNKGCTHPANPNNMGGDKCSSAKKSNK